MASRILWTRRPLINLFVANHVCRRGFSATASSRGPLLDIAVAGPTALLDAIHNTGLPYCLSIPMTAVLVRTTLVYYIFTKPARLRARLHNNILPLLEAKSSQWIRNDTFRYYTQEIQTKDQAAEVAAARIKRGFHALFAVWRDRQKYLKMFGAKSAIVPFFLQFGVLMAFVESIRLKCGRSGGLLSYLLGANPSATPLDPAEALAAKLEAASAAAIARSQGGDVVDLSSISTATSAPADTAVNTSTAALIDISSPYFDPAIQIEGFRFCQDLTQLDPTHIIPLLAGAVFIGSAVFQPIMHREALALNKGSARRGQSIAGDSARLAELAKSSQRWIPQPTFMQSLAFFGATAFAILMHFLPSAIVLYLGPSVLAGWLQKRYLDFRDPIRPGIRRCKIPLRAR